MPQPQGMFPLERYKQIFIRRRFRIGISVAVLVVLLLFWIFAPGGGVVPDSTKWQAVFLNNGQVYFGHLQKTREDYAEITNVYYLRAAQTLQPSASSSSPSFELVKLGGELQGPEDAMYLENSSILFWEN